MASVLVGRARGRIENLHPFSDARSAGDMNRIVSSALALLLWPFAALAAEWRDGRLIVDVPVPVITFGLSASEVAALQAELTPHTVDQATQAFHQFLPPDLEEAKEDGPLVLLPGLDALSGQLGLDVSFELLTLPPLPTARYAVQAAPAALESSFAQALDAARLEDRLFEANAIEDFLSGALPQHGFALNRDAPSIVVLHLDAFGIGQHGWKAQGMTGFLAPVRVFGERHPLLVLDPSAIADPRTTGGGYKRPTASNAAATIAEFARDATEYRLLQGSVYPVSTAPCHAVTGILGVRSTSLGEATPLLRPVSEAFQPERIKAAFDHLTGGDVYFDLKVLALPVDDPVLDAVGRGGDWALDVIIGYLTLTFDRYHVDHPGCEEYLTVVLESDLAMAASITLAGAAHFDDKPGKRIAVGWASDLDRLVADPESPLCAIPADCASKEYLNIFEMLFSHETGHILGQRHPSDVLKASGEGVSNDAFASIWSTMSIEQYDRVIDFGAVDHANWLRNRAGFALQRAAREGREGTSEWQSAMSAVESLDWQGAWEALQP